VTEPVAEDGRAHEMDFGRLLILVRGALKVLRPVIPVDVRGTFVVVQTSRRNHGLWEPAMNQSRQLQQQLKQWRKFDQLML